jgi:hypothetical protein
MSGRSGAGRVAGFRSARHRCCRAVGPPRADRLGGAGTAAASATARADPPHASRVRFACVPRPAAGGIATACVDLVCARAGGAEVARHPRDSRTDCGPCLSAHARRDSGTGISACTGGCLHASAAAHLSVCVVADAVAPTVACVRAPALARVRTARGCVRPCACVCAPACVYASPGRSAVATASAASGAGCIDGSRSTTNAAARASATTVISAGFADVAFADPSPTRGATAGGDSFPSNATATAASGSGERSLRGPRGCPRRRQAHRLHHDL